MGYGAHTDVTWYNKDAKPDADAHAAEIRQIKEQEEDAISVALFVLSNSAFFSFSPFH